mgnify:CR=1 FL=1
MIRLLVIATLTFTLSKPGYSQFRQPSKPNIIYILADDAGYGDFGCYGQKEIHTPNIDSMAAEGMLFTQHYAGAPVCAPSRCSFLTGKHTGNAYIRGNREKLPEGQLALKEDIPTIADMLNTEGYTSAIIGKWGLGRPNTEGVPARHGFNYFFGYLCQRQAHNYYPNHLWQNDEKIVLNGKKYTHDIFTVEALEFIERGKDGPFFLYLAYTIPHADLQVPELGEYADRDWPENKKKYAAMISRLDRDVGRIIEKLRKTGLDRNTLVILTSDNGPHAEGGYDPDYFNSNGPLRGIKRDLYEGGIRVPMIAWWPGTISPGSISNHVSAFWDMMPTFAELSGADVQIETDGISLVPELTGRSKSQRKHEYLYWEFHEQGGKQAIRKGDWKAVRLNVRLFPGNEVALYNLGKDPGETNDVSSEYPAMARELKMMMEEVRSESDVFPLVGKMVYAFGLFNSWIVASVYAIATLLLVLFSRPANRRELLLAYRSWGRRGWYILGLRALVTGLLFCASLVSPLWFGTAWMDTGVLVAVAGISGYIISFGYRLLRKPGTPPVHGLFRISRKLDTFFSSVFWLGVAIVSVSWPIMLLVVLFFITGLLAQRIREDYYTEIYGDEYVMRIRET